MRRASRSVCAGDPFIEMRYLEQLPRRAKGRGRLHLKFTEPLEFQVRIALAESRALLCGTAAHSAQHTVYVLRSYFCLVRKTGLVLRDVCNNVIRHAA